VIRNIEVDNWGSELRISFVFVCRLFAQDSIAPTLKFFAITYGRSQDFTNPLLNDIEAYLHAFMCMSPSLGRLKYNSLYRPPVNEPDDNLIVGINDQYAILYATQSYPLHIWNA
jgi:hypothetical protein